MLRCRGNFFQKVSAPSKTFEKRVRRKGEDHPFKAHSGVDFEFEIHHLSKSLSQGLGPPFMLPTPQQNIKQSIFVCYCVFVPVVSTKRGARAAGATNGIAVFQISVCARANAESLHFDLICPMP